MNNRYLTRIELKKLFEKNQVPIDLNLDSLVAFTDFTDCFLTIEDFKISGDLNSVIIKKYENILEHLTNGIIQFVELEPFKLGTMLSNEDFWVEYCDKTTNPYELCKRVALYLDDASYWTEDVYFQAFN